MPVIKSIFLLPLKKKIQPIVYVIFSKYIMYKLVMSIDHMHLFSHCVYTHFVVFFVDIVECTAKHIDKCKYNYGISDKS